MDKRKPYQQDYYQSHKEQISNQKKAYYQAKKEQKKEERKKKYWAEKQAAHQRNLAEINHAYDANSIRILLSLKEYVELDADKQKLWANFVWTFQDLNEKGFHDLIQIMKLREELEKLLNDYWATTRGEIKKGKSWNALTTEQQERLIKFWGREKAKKEKELTVLLEEQENHGKQYEKAIELAKFHEERGKENCKCWNCAESQKIRSEIRAKRERELTELTQENGKEKEQCPECNQWVKQLDEENGMCKNCVQQFSD